MPDITVSAGLLLATDLSARCDRLPVRPAQPPGSPVPALPQTARLVRAAIARACRRRGPLSAPAVPAPENRMRKPKTPLCLCTRRYLRHCPEG